MTISIHHNYIRIYLALFFNANNHVFYLRMIKLQWYLNKYIFSICYRYTEELTQLPIKRWSGSEEWPLYTCDTILSQRALCLDVSAVAPYKFKRWIMNPPTQRAHINRCRHDDVKHNVLSVPKLCLNRTTKRSKNPAVESTADKFIALTRVPNNLLFTITRWIPTLFNIKKHEILLHYYF